MHKSIEDLYEEKGEYEDAAEVIEHHLVVKMLADTHRLEVYQGVDWREKEETVAYILEKDPCITSQEESYELCSPKDSAHYKDGNTEYEAWVCH